MTKEEIETGIKNALSRNQSLESAMNSMILAGYNLKEVQEVAGNLGLGYSALQAKPQAVVSNIPQTTHATIQQENLGELPQLPDLNQQQQINYMQKSQDYEHYEKKSGHRGKLIALIIVLVLLIGGLASLILFGNQILEYFYGG